jgi:hypothetical protein
MGKLIFAYIVGALVIAPISSVVKAEETTIIKPDRDGDRDKTIIKEREGNGDRTVIEKREELNVLPVPHTEEKTIVAPALRADFSRRCCLMHFRELRRG